MRRLIRVFLFTAIIVFSVFSLVIIGGATVLYRYSKSEVSDDLLNAARSYEKTKFYCFEYEDRQFRTGNAKEIKNASLNSGIKCEYTSYEQLPENLINAFVAIEDKRFFMHKGIDYKRSVGAVLNYVFGGGKTFGGSTITQQLVKNLTGNDDRLVERKLAEAFSALELEKRYEKSEIIEMYMNIINLAHGCRGVGAASQYYFSKPLRELDICECAALAAITNNPSKYDPQLHPRENKQRRDIVLSCMLNCGYISQTEYDSAVKQDLKIQTKPEDPDRFNSWYIDAVIKDVITDFSKKYGVSRQTASLLLYKGGYKIYTAMDMEIQGILDDYFANLDNFPCDENGEIPQASMIIIDPWNGDVLGIAGAVGKKEGNRIQNYATDTRRPPGSAIKPLSVYAPALERGIINWATVIEDSPIRVEEKTKKGWPSNANNKYVGNVNVKYAVENSLNTVAVKILKELGNDISFEFLTKELGIKSLSKKNDMGDASLALGQPSVGITLRELTAAYSVFQSGIMNDSRTYYKVTDSNGIIILDNATIGRNAISEESASIMTKLLQNVVLEGTAAGYITLPDEIEVAGKTGTTQYSHDKYFVGYTPDLLAGVWQGYEFPKSINCYKGNYSICIWDDILNQIYEKNQYMKNQRFHISNNVKQYSYNKTTGNPPVQYDEKNDIELGWFNVKENEVP